MKSIEELLQYARKNYPPGTKCISIFKHTDVTIIGEPFLFSVKDREQRICVEVEEDVDSPDGTVAIYSKDLEWAKIISKPKLNYEIY